MIVITCKWGICVPPGQTTVNPPLPSHHVMDESGNVSKSNRRDPVPMELVISKKTLTDEGWRDDFSEMDVIFLYSPFNSWSGNVRHIRKSATFNFLLNVYTVQMNGCTNSQGTRLQGPLFRLQVVCLISYHLKVVECTLINVFVDLLVYNIDIFIRAIWS